MFNKQNFCHVASNNRNEVKIGVFVYKTTDDLEAVLVSGYFNDKIIDINLHDLIIHEWHDPADRTKVQRNVLCVTERTLDNVGTQVIQSKWEKSVDDTIEAIQDDIETIQGDIDDIKEKNEDQDDRLDDLEQNVAYKATDFVTPITNNNKGITQTEETELNNKIDTAANSGEQLTNKGVWYAKMYAATVAPAAEDGTNYADFSQTDIDGNPVIVLYERQNGAWVQTQTITPPIAYNGYVTVTSKIWDIVEQDGQQGGQVLWSHNQKTFTPYPKIVSFEDAHLTGNSTTEMPAQPTGQTIVNVDYLSNHTGSGKNVGDVFFTMRNDSALSGAVECNGATYNTEDFVGTGTISGLLSAGKIPYVSLATYATLLSTQGSCGVFGWDGAGTTAFRVPSLNDIFIETGTAAQIGDYIAPAAPNINAFISDVHRQQAGTVTGAFTTSNPGAVRHTQTNSGMDVQPFDVTFSASNSSGVYKDSATTIQPNTVRYRAMVQLATGATDEALETCTQVLADVAANTAAIAGADYVVESQLPTAQNNYTWYRKYKSGWVEQGGQHVPATSSDIDHTSNSITLPVEMADTNYSILTSQVQNSVGSQFWDAPALARRTSTTTINACFFGQVANATTIQWEVKGMAA